MANRAEEMDFSLHLMLSLQCRAPGLLATDQLPAFLPLTPVYFMGRPAGKVVSLHNLVLRVGMKVSCPTSDLMQEQKVEWGAHFCVCHGVSPILSSHSKHCIPGLLLEKDKERKSRCGVLTLSCISTS